MKIAALASGPFWTSLYKASKQCLNALPLHLEAGASSPPILEGVFKLRGGNMEMKAEEIDDEGCWNSGGKRWVLLGSSLPIPPAASVSGKLEHEEVLAVLNSDLGACPVCSAHCTDVLGTVLMTEHYRLIPSRCCLKMIWYYEPKVVDSSLK